MSEGQPDPEVKSFGWQWSGNGWTIKLNRYGDIYPSDSRIPRPEQAAFLAAVEAAFDFELPPLEPDEETDETPQAADR